MRRADDGGFRRAMDELFGGVAWLNVRWRTYLSLFGGDATRLDVLNRRTGEVFGVFQRVLWDAILLDVARLLARRKSGGPAVTLDRAVAALPPSVERADLTVQVERLREKHGVMLARRDRASAVAPDGAGGMRGVVPVTVEGAGDEGIGVAQVREAVEDLAGLLNEIGRVGNHPGYVFPAGAEEDAARALCRVLALGNAAAYREEAARRPD